MIQWRRRWSDYV